MWANGLMGKVDRLLLPIFKGTDKEKELKKIKERSKDINDERNNVVHRGQFKAKKTAERVISEAEYIINSFSSLAGSGLTVSSEIDEEDEDT
jgi:predicted transcriptional regulator